eukprot:5843475-Pleurochrysis_carterae.AAC.2
MEASEKRILREGGEEPVKEGVTKVKDNQGNGRAMRTRRLGRRVPGTLSGHRRAGLCASASLEMAQDSAILREMARSGARWREVARDGVRWLEMA